MQPGTKFSFHSAGVRNYGVALKGGRAVLLRLGGVEVDVVKGGIPENAEAISDTNPVRGAVMSEANTFFKTAILMMEEE